MRRYTIAKTLALYLGVLSVVARSLPERRSEINVRSPADVGYSKQRLEELGLVLVSEGVLNGNIHTATYSMSKNTTFPKRDDATDIRSQESTIVCSAAKVEAPGLDDCQSVYNQINTQFLDRAFTVQRGGVILVYLRDGGCKFAFDGSKSLSAFTYDYNINTSQPKGSGLSITASLEVPPMGFAISKSICPPNFPLLSVEIGLLLRKTAAKGATTATALTWDFTSRRGHSM